MRYKTNPKRILETLDINWVEPRGDAHAGAIFLTKRAPGEEFIVVNHESQEMHFTKSEIVEAYEDEVINVSHRRKRGFYVGFKKIGV